MPIISSKNNVYKQLWRNIFYPGDLDRTRPQTTLWGTSLWAAVAEVSRLEAFRVWCKMCRAANNTDRFLSCSRRPCCARSVPWRLQPQQPCHRLRHFHCRLQFGWTVAATVGDQYAVLTAVRTHCSQDFGPILQASFFHYTKHVLVSIEHLKKF